MRRGRKDPEWQWDRCGMANRSPQERVVGMGMKNDAWMYIYKCKSPLFGLPSLSSEQTRLANYENKENQFDFESVSHTRNEFWSAGVVVFPIRIASHLVDCMYISLATRTRNSLTWGRPTRNFPRMISRSSRRTVNVCLHTIARDFFKFWLL